jgi:hypothetical protein
MAVFCGLPTNTLYPQSFSVTPPIYVVHTAHRYFSHVHIWWYVNIKGIKGIKGI